MRKDVTATADSALSDAKATYVRSKVESEREARALQSEGAPVVTVFPGGTHGPHDPGLSDQMRRMRDVLRGLYPTWPKGGYHLCDVRDVARVIAAVIEPGRGPRAFAVPGHHGTADRYFGALRSVTGRRLPTAVLPPATLKPVAFVGSALQRFVPFHIPAEHEGAVTLSYNTRIDASATTTALGIEPRPWETTVADSVRWLHGAGHITRRQAGLALAT